MINTHKTLEILEVKTIDDIDKIVNIFNDNFSRNEAYLIINEKGKLILNII